MFLAKVSRTIRKFRMLSSGDRVVVAVSGGPDSVCLLIALQELAKDLDLALHVTHLDHMFRGEESAAEARFVAALAEKNGLPSTIERIDVPSYCREHGLSAQAGAREVRYRFLNDVAAGIKANRIAMGHTADDQAETLLMRLIRGAGPAGLSAIPPTRDNVIRPLIETTRAGIMLYLQERAAEFVTDSSNLKPLYTRNRIRSEVIPLLERYNPGIVETLAAEAALLRDEEEAMQALLGPVMARVLRDDGDAVRIDREGFRGLPPALQRRALRTALARLAEAGQGLSLVQTEEARAFLAEALTGRAVALPFGLVLEREYDAFVLRRGAEARELSARLEVPGTTEIPRLSLVVETSVLDAAAIPDAVAESGGNYLWQALFDYDKIALPLTVRTRRPGDWFRPAGMGGGGKKLQDYFVDGKVPRRKRDQVPLLATERDILWIVGMRTDGRFLPDAGTKRLLVARVLRSGVKSKE